MTQLIEPASDSIYDLLRRDSSFHVLQRTVAWLLQYQQAHRRRAFPSLPPPEKGFRTLHEMSQATLAIVKAVQKEAFPDITCVT